MLSLLDNEILILEQERGHQFKYELSILERREVVSFTSDGRNSTAQANVELIVAVVQGEREHGLHQWVTYLNIPRDGPTVKKYYPVFSMSRPGAAALPQSNCQSVERSLVRR
jgi:hypothetical protein